MTDPQITTFEMLRDEFAKLHARLDDLERKLDKVPYVKVLDDPDIFYVVEAMRAQKAADKVSALRNTDERYPVPQR